LSIRKIAGLMNPGLAIDSLDAAVKQAKRDIRAGRTRLHDDGVLPWAAYDAGYVESEWWKSGQLADAIQQWRAEAVTAPAPPPEVPSIDPVATAERAIAPLSKMLMEGLRPVADGFGEAIARGLGVPDRATRLREIERDPWHWPG
jgi:hypothetical protein